MNSLKRALLVVTLLCLFLPVTIVHGQEPLDQGDISIPSIGLEADLTSSHIEIFTSADGQLRQRWSVPDYPYVGWRQHNLQLNLVGHRPGIFSGLTYLKSGDIITLIFDESGEIRRFSVESAFSMENQYYRDHYDDLMQGNVPRLMILACDGPNYRFVVFAPEIEGGFDDEYAEGDGGAQQVQTAPHTYTKERGGL